MSQIKTRRSFLKIAGGLAVAAPFIAKFPRASAAVKRFDQSFGTASEAAVAIQAGVISSRELVEHVFRRNDEHNPAIAGPQTCR